MYKYLKTAGLILFLFYFSCASSGKTIKNSSLPKKNGISVNFEQVVEGRIFYSAKVLVLGGKSQILRDYSAAVSGKRKYNDKGFTDTFENIKKLKGNLNLLHSADIIFVSSDSSNPQDVVTKGISDVKFDKQLKSLYRFVHTLPMDSIVSGKTWSLTDVTDIKILGKNIRIKRVFTFKIVGTDKIDGTVKIEGKYTAESLDSFYIKGFKIGIVAKGNSEAEYSPLKGVWTHIKASLVQGWVGSTVIDKSGRKVTAGYRQILDLNFYFSDK